MLRALAPARHVARSRRAAPAHVEAPSAPETAPASLDPLPRHARTTARRLLPALVLALLAVVGNAPSAAAAYAHDSYEVKFADLINDYRQSRGLKRYWVDPAYSYWANWRSTDMCNRRYFSHTIPRIRSSAYYWPGGGNLHNYWDYRRLGAGNIDRFNEIISYNYYSSGWLYTLFRQFRNSSLHNSIMLSPNYKYDRIGVGVHTCGSRHHATVVFIQR